MAPQMGSAPRFPGSGIRYESAQWKASAGCPTLARETGGLADGSVNLVEGSYAAGTEFHSLGQTILVDSDFLYVRLPLAFRLYVRVTDAVSKRWSLAAHFASGHDCTSPT